MNLKDDRDMEQASAAGGAVQPDHTRDELLFALRRMLEMTEIYRNIEITDEPATLMRQVALEAVKIPHCDACAIVMVESPSAEFVLRQSLPEDQADLWQREVDAQIESGTFAWAVGRNRPTIMSPLAFTDAGEPVTLLACPLTTIRQVFGMLFLRIRQGEQEVFQETFLLLSTLAHLFAFAWENTALYGSVMKANSELERRVSERTRELQEANQELKGLDQLKDDFIALAAHELRTPITTILGYAELLGDTEDFDPDYVKEVAETVQTECDRFTRMINDMLDLSKLESGKLDYDMRPNDANAIIRECLSAHHPAFESKKQTLEVDLQKDLPPVRCDADRLYQVVANLLGNANKYTPEGGRIEVASHLENGVFRLSVRDSGIGIEAKDANRVFNKFEQIERTAHHRKGTGLGMPISKQIVESGHGGKIWFESEGWGAGTTFNVTIPMQEESK